MGKLTPSLAAETEAWRESEQVDVYRRADCLPEPQERERCALQDELVGVLRRREAVEQAFPGKSKQRELVIDAERLAMLGEPRLNGGDDVLRRRPR